ncbi:hypothetical protein ACFWPV_12240 [Streptomyces uncialis]|uniref:hypothetical protein n=1 Tax=Streptomyces uncialis TaxID=1048205 RepID=UPI00364B6351
MTQALPRVDAVAALPPVPLPPVPVIGERDLLALRLAANGRTVAESALELGMSETAVRESLAHAARALGRTDTTGAVSVAVVHRLVTSSDITAPGRTPAPGELTYDDHVLLRNLVHQPDPARAGGPAASAGPADPLLRDLRSVFGARSSAHIAALALLNGLVPCSVADGRFPDLPVGRLPALRLPTVFAEAVAHAAALAPTAGATGGTGGTDVSDERLRQDLHAARYATTLSSERAGGSRGRRAAVLGEAVHRWAPVARACRAHAAGSPAQSRFWDEVIAGACGPVALARPLTDTAGFAHGVHRMLQAIKDTRQAGGVTAAGLAAELAAGVADGTYYPGCRTHPRALARMWGVPLVTAEAAFTDLIAAGVLERAGAGACPAGSGAARDGHHRTVAARLRDQFTAGLHRPGTVLARPDLSAALFAADRDLTRVFQALADEGLVIPRRSGSVLVAPAARFLDGPERLGPPAPYAMPYHPAAITDTVRVAVDRWRFGHPEHPHAVRESWDTLRRMAVQLLREAGPGDAPPVRQAVDALTAPWPAGARHRVWHTACLARTIHTLQEHLNEPLDTGPAPGTPA